MHTSVRLTVGLVIVHGIGWGAYACSGSKLRTGVKSVINDCVVVARYAVHSGLLAG